MRDATHPRSQLLTSRFLFEANHALSSRNTVASKDCTHLFVGGFCDNAVRVVHAASRKCVALGTAHRAPVTCLAIDVGANFGYYSLLAAVMGGWHHAVTTAAPAVRKGAFEALTAASHKLAEVAYQNAGGPEGAAPGAGPAPESDGGDDGSDDVIDAEFEEA